MNRIQKPKTRTPYSSTLHHHSDGVLSRQARAPTGNRFAEFVNRMEIISRVTNRMNLQSSKVSGNVHVDDVIKQLLPVGSLPLQKLNRFSSETVTAAMEKYEELPTELKGDAVEEVSKSLVNSLSHLQNARTVWLREEVPSDLTRAADGFRKIKELIDKRSKLEPLMEIDMKSIVESAKKFQKELHPVHFNLLKSIEKLQKSINRMFDGISQLQKEVDQFESKSLPSNGMVFDAADDIVRVSENYGLWVAALESLNETDSDLKILGVVESLRTLRDINFDVAEYRFLDSKSSLADLDMFFARFAEEISPPYYQHYVPLPTKKRYISYEPRPEPDRQWALYVYFAALALSLLIVTILFFTWTEPEDDSDSEDDEERVATEQRRRKRKRRRHVEIFAE